jgi:hypothetical protein
MPIERKEFVLKWKKDHEDKIIGWLGSIEDGVQFLSRIFFAPSFVNTIVPCLQKVFMADTCHLHFGKYTLFLCYGITANSNASPVAFAMIFGNKNTSTWRQFWKYAIELHPYIDSGNIMSITNQDKGQKTPLLSIHSRLVTFIVLTINDRISLRCAEEVVGK